MVSRPLSWAHGAEDVVNVSRGNCVGCRAYFSEVPFPQELGAKVLVAKTA